MMHLFYAQQLVLDNIIALEPDEAQHAAKVLRMREGDAIQLTDGKGIKAEGKILSITRRDCVLRIVRVEQQEPPVAALHLAVAPPKNIKRFEWLLEKATEVGVHSILPFVSQHSERKDLKTERLQKLILSAAKQSIKFHMPHLQPLCAFNELLQCPFLGNKLMAYCKADDNVWMDKQLTIGKDALILIGPEGGFSEEEYRQAMQQHFKPLRLSTSRLRTETAALIACQQMAFINKY